MKKIDTRLIHSINPDIIYGGKLGLSGDETIELAEITYKEMKQKVEDTAPMAVFYDEEMTESGYEVSRPICPKCDQRHLYRKQRFCDKCGVEIIWE